ncbi:hypothetical protein BC938DRAFT_481515 [Jimgerdemannia flammicorona]|uniref:Ricin B lectin domain-containing protein n=1 Tax=Jimgerdemannia flammicorona TaxID=994334 RepID=A0A433QG45_9FUNG|nr:hypothetical protein BC938DRAFT_481515 [Jimgerdemannia flammicorona]
MFPTFLISLLPSLALLLLLPATPAQAATSPYAAQTEVLVYDASVPIAVGFYTFRNRVTNQYLLFDTNKHGNTVVPATGKKNVVSNATTWKIVRHAHSNRNYSIHHDASNGADKCISTRYTNGSDDAAIMWYIYIYSRFYSFLALCLESQSLGDQNAKSISFLSLLRGCRIDTKQPVLPARRRSLFRRREPPFLTKQTWLFIPADSHKAHPAVLKAGGPSGKSTDELYYYIVSNAHLFNLVPSCLYPRLSSFGTTALSDCMAPNGTSLYPDQHMHWKLVKVA